jgi:hypothetical protein
MVEATTRQVMAENPESFGMHLIGDVHLGMQTCLSQDGFAPRCGTEIETALRGIDELQGSGFPDGRKIQGIVEASGVVIG